MISSEVFHESGETFNEGTKRDEGVMKHYLRHVYLVVGMVLSVTTFMKMYQMSFSVLELYEDYLDWVIFQHVKRGRSVDSLGKIFYNSDRYSAEYRTN